MLRMHAGGLFHRMDIERGLVRGLRLDIAAHKIAASEQAILKIATAGSPRAASGRRMLSPSYSGA